MGKKMFWAIIVGVIIFGVLAATRSIWQDPMKQDWAVNYIEKITILPKEKSDAYAQSCSACHMLYAPATLPSRSWEKIMQGLADHFGDNAEIDETIRTEVTAYLVDNAADHDVENLYAKPLLNLLESDELPLRISDTKYFKIMHDFVKPDMVEGNPKVKTFARCEACHYEALGGRFNRKAVIIPNYHLDRVGFWKRGEKKVLKEQPVKQILE